MKIALSWLKQHLATTAPVDELARTLNRIGLEVDGVEDTAAAFKNVVIGHIKERVQHPNADRLGVCQVDVGEGKLRQIVCGAPNARAGLTVAVALPGAVLPGDFAIKESKIRGETSLGMICGIDELGLDKTGTRDIWEMTTTAAPGTPLATVLGSEVMIEVAVTPNRGDALSYRGIARDLAAAGVGTLKPFVAPQPYGTTPCAVEVKLETPLCRVFVGATITGIQQKEYSDSFPGVKKIFWPVDMTNYTLLDLGQPSHAFDADKIRGVVRVQEAKGGEAFAALDGKTYTLAAGDIVFADDSGIIALAGIMGGASTATSATTTNLFIEAAQFERTQIARTGQRLGILSDARYRFERGIDPAMTAPAHAVVVDKIIGRCGGTVSAVMVVGELTPAPRTLAFDTRLVARLGGLELPTATTLGLLKKLGYGVAGEGEVVTLTVPTWITTFDGAPDVVEDVLRLHGYDGIPSVMPPLQRSVWADKATRFQTEWTARRALAERGYLETLTYSFIAPADATAVGGHGAPTADKIDPQLVLNNPISAEMAVLRPSLLPGLLQAVRANLARSAPQVALAEVGTCFWSAGEVLLAAAVRTGSKKDWQRGSVAPTVYDVKADALALLATYGLSPSQLLPLQNAAEFHPGQAMALEVQGQPVGAFGAVHPVLLKHFGIKQPVMAMALNLEKILTLAAKPKAYTVSDFQPVTRDVALVVEASVAAGAVQQALQQADRTLVQAVEVFDVYAGDKLPAGKKSLALSVTLQAADRTLTEAEIAAVMEKAIAAVVKKFGAVVR